MENELNKKLCELLGIEPLITDHCKSGPIDCDGQCGNCDKSTEIELLPDFFDPVNTLMLLECITKANLLDIRYHHELKFYTPFGVNACINGDTIQEFLIKISIAYLKRVAKFESEATKQKDFKQQAQQVNWMY